MKSSTCIVGWIEKSKAKTTVYLGADSQGSISYSKSHGIKKIIEKGDFLIGVTGALYAINLLKNVWEVPERKVNQMDEQYLNVDVIKSLRTLFKNNGHSYIANNKETISENIMLVYNGKIYIIYCDFCLLQVNTSYAAIGCGEKYALGVCFALADNKKLTIEDKIRKSILAASTFSMGVDSQIYITKMEYPRKWVK